MKSYFKDQYSLSRFSSDQWKAYKAIRLEALQTNPEMFGSNFAKESQYSEQEWRAPLQSDQRAMFALYDGEEIIGVTGIVLKKEDDSKAVLIASFIKPEYRGQGLSKLFYQARIDWAREKGCESVIVAHRDGNEKSKAANQSFGFEYTHTEETIWPDGVSAGQLNYRLKL